MEKFPKKMKLKDGIPVILRLMMKDDGPKLLKFFQKLPAGDRLFLKDDVTDKATINRWVEQLDYGRVLPLLAESKGEIIGNATLHMQNCGWAMDVAEIRCVVAKKFQRKGLGTTLLGELFQFAVDKGIRKVQAQMMEDQMGAIKVFTKLGFKKEAVFQDHVTDLEGKRHNLLIMSITVAKFWEEVEDFVSERADRMEH